MYATIANWRMRTERLPVGKFHGIIDVYKRERTEEPCPFLQYYCDENNDIRMRNMVTDEDGGKYVGGAKGMDGRRMLGAPLHDHNDNQILRQMRNVEGVCNDTKENKSRWAEHVALVADN